MVAVPHVSRTNFLINSPDAIVESAETIRADCKRFCSPMICVKKIINQLNLSNEDEKLILNLLKKKSPPHDVDIPNPKFKGPF